jgi:hypothetical protein
VERLGQAGMHARPLSGGQNYYSKPVSHVFLGSKRSTFLYSKNLRFFEYKKVIFLFFIDYRTL